MPYEIDPNNKKCIRKADSKKRVGCTKGSVKKYLAALHANVNESTKLNESKKYPGIVRKPKVGDRVIVNGWYGEEGNDPRDIVLKFDNELGTIVDVDVAPGLSFPSGGEVIISFDRWRLPGEDDGGFEYIDDSCLGKKCMQFSNLLRNDYDFSIKPLSKDMDVKDFDAFENLYESEEDEFNWVDIETPEINPLLTIGSYFKAGYKDYPIIIKITGISEPTINGDPYRIVFSSFNSHDDGEWESNNKEDLSGANNLVDKHHKRYWWTPITKENISKYYDPKKYKKFLQNNINESEDDNLGWAQDIVNTESIDITKDKKHIDLLKVGSIISITGYWESLTFNNDKATIIEGHDGTRSFLLKFDRVVESEDDTSHCGDLKHEKICECEHNNVIGKCWYTDISQMDSVIWYPYEHTETLNESEENDLEWAEDLVSSSSILDLLKFTGKEYMIDIRGFTQEEKEWLYKSLEPLFVNRFEFAQDWDPKCIIKKPNIKSVSLHCGTDDDDYEPSDGRICCLDYTFVEEKNNTNSILPVDGKMLLTMKPKDISESEEDNLEWAQDIVSNVDSEIRYSNFSEGGKLLPDGAILKITGHQDDIDFNNQECKVIRFMDEENDRYLCVFPEYIYDGQGGSTHCGDRQDKEKCHCQEEDGGEGRCYEIEMDHMSEVYYYPNRLKLTTESEEEKPLLTEGRYDAITRKAVNDIMVVVKETANQVEFNQAVLPSGLGGDEEYTQEGMSFSIELNIHHQPLFNDRVVTKESDAYYVHTAVADEEDENVIMMTIVVDPAWEPQIYERLFYKLQEDIRHEIEHLTQLGIHRISDRPTSRTNTAQLKTTFGHHKHKLEVPALVHGFYRRAKLEKRPIDEVMIEDLDSEIEKGNLTKRAAQSLLAIWVDYSKKNLPSAIYSQE